MSVDLGIIKAELQEKLSPHRYKHIESVSETAVKLAKALSKYHPEVLTEDYIHKIEMAAWLHDRCKELHSAEMISLAKHYGIKIYDEDLAQPNILHARVGAAYAEDVYEIYDPIILSAIREHTFGAIDMNLASKILYLADAIEPLRRAKQQQVLGAETEFDKIMSSLPDIDSALLRTMSSKMVHVINKGQRVHPLGVEARNAMIK
jgi:predicted HD superfamily hydrolase involved in NAD metabolism